MVSSREHHITREHIVYSLDKTHPPALEIDPGDVRVTEALAPLVPDAILSLSESSLRTPEEVQRAIRAGADAVLVGTALLQAEDLKACLEEFTRGR